MTKKHNPIETFLGGAGAALGMMVLFAGCYSLGIDPVVGICVGLLIGCAIAYPQVSQRDGKHRRDEE